MNIDDFSRSTREAAERGRLGHATGVTVDPSLFYEVVEKLRQAISADPFDLYILDKPEKEPTIKRRVIKEWVRHLHLSGRSGMKLGVILNADTLTEEAANALLKTIEEPPSRTHLLLCAERDNFLPTIRSRIRMYGLSQPSSSSKISFPDSTLDVIKTAESWQKEKTVRERLRQWLGGASISLREGKLSAHQVERIHDAYINEQVGINGRLLVESLLLDYV